MEAALDGLAGIEEVEVDLSQDAFTVTYEPSLVTESEIAQEIVQLGFVPRIHTGGKLVPTPSPASTAAIPEPIVIALGKARESARPVFIDFYAEWCAPCKIIEGKIIPDPRVQAALDGFIFVRVDMDIDLKAGGRFEVFGMPTLLVLSSEGKELFRHVGLIEPGDLAERLLEIRSRTSIPRE